MNLNIIGNGFDLYHGFPSSYYYFGCYLIENDNEFYEHMGDLYGFMYRKNVRTYPDLEFDYKVENIFWSEFENHLGDIEDGAIVDTHNPFLGLEIEEYDIPMNEDEEAEKIKEAFIHWVSDSVDANQNYQILKKFISGSDKRAYTLDFNDEDRFLVFNYTHILQKIYGINEIAIQYVHGECTGSEDDELIIGHGNSERIKELNKIIQEYDSRSLSQTGRTKQLEYECLKSFIRRLQKDVECCMGMCDWFYDRITEEPEYINVYGLSYGNVDIPYLLQIREKWVNSKWRFSYYSTRDEIRAREVATNELKLKPNEYETFQFINNDSSKILKNIIRAQGITEY